MGDLIWVGNTLLPRGLVWGVGIIIALVVIGAFTVLTDEITGEFHERRKRTRKRKPGRSFH
jgi:hypothetical protein